MCRFLACFALCVLCLLPVGAAGPSGDDLVQAPSDSLETPPSVVVQDSSSSDFLSALSGALADLLYQGDLDEVSAISVPMDDSGVSPLYDIDDGQTTEPAGTLKALLVKLIGPYNPVIVQYRYQTNTSGNYSYLREIQLDYVWIASAALFALVIFCTFRLGGVLLRRI